MTRRFALPCACQRCGAACMRKKCKKPPFRKIVLRLPDLDHTRAAVLNSLSSLILGGTTSSLWSNSSPGIAPNPALP